MSWRKETLQIIIVLACVYLLIMCLMVMQLQFQERRVSFLSDDQEHEKMHFSLKSDYCYKGPEIPQILRKTSLTVHAIEDMQSKNIRNCSLSGNLADLEMEKLWNTIDVSYPLALSVSGWLDVVQVYSWIQKPLKVIIVPHSHQDPGWLNTFEYYFETQTNKTLNLMVDQLTKNPTWRFVWSEVCWLDRWWKKATQVQKDNFKRLIMNGQIEIVSGGWVMVDEAVVHYSAMLNQLIDGHQWLLSHLGVTPNISWAIDPFGHSATMAYLQRRSGTKAMVIQRIHFAIKRQFSRKKTLEFKWRQLWDRASSTDITTHVLPFSSYAITHSCGPNSHICCQFDFYQKKCYQGKKKIPVQEVNNSNVKERAWLLWEQFQKKSELFQENVLLVPHGDDFRYSNLKEWEQQFHNLEKLMGYINNNSEMNTQVRFGTLSDYFKELQKMQTKPLPTFSGDFFPYSDRSDQYWTGFYTTRPHLKYLARRIQSLLRSMEILYAMMVAKTNKTSRQAPELMKLLSDLEVGRQEVALFQHHDAITGTSRKSVTEHYTQRLQHAFNKVNALFEKVTLFHLELSFGITPKNHTVSMINDWMNLMTDKKRKKIVNLSKKRYFLVYNPLGHSRREIITLTVDRPNVKVTKHPKLLVIPHQISPVWENTAFATDCYELMFELSLPALSFTMVAVEETETKLNTRVVFFTKPDKIHKNLIIPGLTIQQDNSPFFLISNGFLTACFYTCNGRLQYVMQNSTGLLWKSEVKVMTYTSGKSWSTMFKDKGGAYTFVPDGPAETLSEPVDAFFLIDGPLFSRVVTVQPTITQTVTLYNTNGIMGMGVHIENNVNMQSLDNTELMMRVESDIEGPKTEMCVDLNGFQMHRKTTLTKRHIQGNFYPMTTMASVENEASKLTLLTTSARGVASLSTGWLEVGLDRRMNQDDWRGLGEGITDNVSTRSAFMLVLEPKSSNKISQICYPTVLTDLLSDELENPSIVAETSAGIHNQLMSDPALSMTKQELPCNVHLLNLRVLAPEIKNYSETMKGPDAEFTTNILLILHKKEFDCNVEIGSSICAKNASVIRLADVFIDCSIVQAWETTLFGSGNTKELQRPYNVAIDPMEIKTFRVLCS